MHLFAQRGYEGTTNRAIADGCGLTGAAIYHYFDSKAELYAAVYEAVFARVFDELERPSPANRRSSPSTPRCSTRRIA
jgi:AcrR family transcriptional regulator